MDPLNRGDEKALLSPILFVFVLLLFVLPCTHADFGHTRENASLTVACELRDAELLEEMRAYLGIPYRRGGSTRRGTDCSGLIRQMYGDLFNLDIPHNAAAQNRLPIVSDVPRDDLRVGDLIFFGPDKRRISHIGAYLSDGKFIHASSKLGKTTISSLSNSYWQKRFIRSGRINGLEFVRSRPNTREGDTAARAGNIFWETAAFESEAGAGLSSDVSMSAFFDVNVKAYTLFLHEPPSGIALFPPESSMARSGNSRVSMVRQGVRFSADWVLFDWIQVAPFWTCIIEHDQVADQSVTEVRNMGVSAEIAHPNRRWTISIAAQPPSYAPQSTHPFPWNTNWREMDLFIGWRYHISNAWKLSLLGFGHAGLPEGEAASVAPSRWDWLPEVEDMTIRMDVSF